MEIREVLSDLATRLAAAPEEAARLVRKRGEVSDALHRALDAMKEAEAAVAGEVAAARNGDGRPLYPNEQARQAEIQRRLAADQGYQARKAEVERLRQQLREIDAQAELVGRRHRSDCQVASLAAALLGAGLKEEALAALEAYAEGLKAGQEKPVEVQGQGQDQAQPQAQNQADAARDSLEEGTFKVLEARANEKGVVRAWCEGPQGKVALFAKNGAAKVLQSAVGKQVKARYRQVDKGLFVVEVRPVA